MSTSVQEDTSTHRLHRGTRPLLLSIPHLGTALPEDIAAQLAPVAALRQDTDWHLDRLHDFAERLGASVLQARVSRYAIDLNRPPGGESLYPGRITTGLCPTETFRGEPLYAPGREPDAAEVERRRLLHWQPYHDALAQELQRLRARHGAVLLWDAHSIASRLPRLFEGRLPDLNLGTADGRSCDAALLQQVVEACDRLRGDRFTRVVNGRFKGGHITRHHGRPGAGVHAIQLEMCQSLYMDEDEPFGYRPELAAQVQPVLQAMLEAGLAGVEALARQSAGRG